MGRKKKEWLTTIDGRERPDHAAANGQVVLSQDAFTVSGERLRFPGDPQGSPGNTINCRCTVLPVIGEMAQAEGIEGRGIVVERGTATDEEMREFGSAIDGALTTFEGYGLPSNMIKGVRYVRWEGSHKLMEADPFSGWLDINLAERRGLEDIYSAFGDPGIPLMAQQNLHDSMVHELAHLMGFGSGKRHNEWVQLFDTLKDDVANWPSYYAQENNLEAWAETTTAILTGKTIPSDAIRNLALKVLGAMRR